MSLPPNGSLDCKFIMGESYTVLEEWEWKEVGREAVTKVLTGPGGGQNLFSVIPGTHTISYTTLSKSQGPHSDILMTVFLYPQKTQL